MSGDVCEGYGESGGCVTGTGGRGGRGGGIDRGKMVAVVRESRKVSCVVLSCE